MAELHLCASVVDASSALHAMEEEVKVKGQDVNVAIAEISAELQRERQRNAELVERISVLESQTRQRERESSLLNSNGQGSCHGNNIGKRKRQKVEGAGERTKNGHVDKSKLAIAMIPKEESREEKTRFSDSRSSKDQNVVADFEDMGSSDDAEGAAVTSNEFCCSFPGIAGKEENRHGNMNANPIQKEMSDNMNRVNGVMSFQKDPLQKKPYKMAFCPKEIQKILESDILLQKNAESHTMRKIIVFSSLGIRHGCEDLYELDFNHFKILRKGETYVSPENPGEHVLYENPGFRRKIFYPNRTNFTICPVQIIEEEKAMRPSDLSCPSSLFLCIKYGGSTRNLPQNEYVRQQMGRNKLKSFGPLMCRMASLVNVRGGSFFFKALGITLLFMAGVSNDLVRSETKYQSLDLLQKYYRRDEDAEGEQLFLKHLRPLSTVSLHIDKPFRKRTLTYKSKTTPKGGANNKIQNAEDFSANHSPSTSCAPQFGLIGYRSNHHNQAAATQPVQPWSRTPRKTSATSIPENPGRIHSEYSSTLRPVNCFMPMMFWHPPNAYYLPTPTFPCSYSGYPPLPLACPLNVLPGETVGDKVRNVVVSGEADGQSNRSS